MSGRQRGSATIWVVCAGALLWLICWAAVLRGLAVLGRHRAESAADAAALAAAGRIGLDQRSCAWAGSAAVVNGSSVSYCRVRLAADGRSGSVAVRVVRTVRLPVLGPVSVSAVARAARLPGTGAMTFPAPPGAEPDADPPESP